MKIGGVPEHYNAPFRKSLNNGSSSLFSWQDFPSGTGALLEALEAKEIDLAIVLTEGAVRHAITKKSIQILGKFVANPLPWGVHVRDIDSMTALNDRLAGIGPSVKFGISRYGSGSHLMAVVHAKKFAHNDSSFEFVVVNTMAGASEAMKKGEIDVFLWDIPTASKYTREGVWKVIGTVTADWPAFVFVIRKDPIGLFMDHIARIMKSVFANAASLMDSPDASVKYLCDEYKLLEPQAREFLSTIKWTKSVEDMQLGSGVLSGVGTALMNAGVFDKPPSSLAESNMYDWRIKAFETWIEKNSNGNSLSMDKLCAAGHLDQYHYLGLAANDEVIDILQLNPTMTVLDVGCGIGGPARYFAWKTGCRVVGVDIQPDLVKMGNKVTGLVGLTDLVELKTGDLVVESIVGEFFDVFVSLLVILHIADRERLFSNLYSALKPAGGFLIEDMVKMAEFDSDETRIASSVIGAPNLPSIEEYRAHLESAGFVDIEFEDLTEPWVRWSKDRSDTYIASESEQIANYGEKIFNQRSAFYADVKSLFGSGKLGGVRITGRKPGVVETTLIRHRTGTRKCQVVSNNPILEQ
jgi:cyclopropane fatty-acyl-phospholipid synthase-like methyltransferase